MIHPTLAILAVGCGRTQTTAASISRKPLHILLAKFECLNQRVYSLRALCCWCGCRCEHRPAIAAPQLRIILNTPQLSHHVTVSHTFVIQSLPIEYWGGIKAQRLEERNFLLPSQRRPILLTLWRAHFASVAVVIALVQITDAASVWTRITILAQQTHVIHSTCCQMLPRCTGVAFARAHARNSVAKSTRVVLNMRRILLVQRLVKI
mmetsp:Transcript_41213/g.60653  ORF Transcript_41213/g.60653 Transcript_41213/m.60653 type:complete len:207 (-) Transcript_41213:476-1096(-)